jgi:hypothetical protein
MKNSEKGDNRSFVWTRWSCWIYLGTDHLTWKGGGLWFFVSFRIFFSDNTRIRIFFFVAQSATFFLQNSTLDYMTKTLNHIIFFFLYQNQNIFFSNIGNQNIFLEKKHNPPFKLNGRSLISLYNEESLKLD